MSKEICQESWLILQGRQTQTGVPHEDRTTVEAAAAAAKSLQSCLVLCDPMNSSPPGSSVYGILQTRILEWIAISLSPQQKKM